MNISISEEVRARCPEAALGILQYEAQVAPSSSALLELFEHTLRELSECHTLDSIAQIPHIAATRSAYKALGKSPHEYRNAAEAMLRRNPTSDSQRAMIQKGRRSILSVLYAFDGKGDLELWLDRFSQLLRQWCGVDTVETRIV